MATKDINPPPPTNRLPAPSLIEAFVIVLISAGVVLFIFWISTQFLGDDKFSNLPGWLQAVFKNVWAAIATGATGIGLAIVNALKNPGRPQPDYLKYIAISVLVMFIPITILIAASVSMKPHGPFAIQPPNTSTIIFSKTNSSDFDLETPPGFALRYVLRGTFTVNKSVLTGHLVSGTVEVPKYLPPAFPQSLNRISFRACYIDPASPEQPRFIYPTYAKSRDSLDVNFQLSPGASYVLPKGEFSFELPDSKHVKAAWLCAALKTPEMSEFPAE
jgi:hypothetical protein